MNYGPLRARALLSRLRSRLGLRLLLSSEPLAPELAEWAASMGAVLHREAAWLAPLLLSSGATHDHGLRLLPLLRWAGLGYGLS